MTDEELREHKQKGEDYHQPSRVALADECLKRGERIKAWETENRRQGEDLVSMQNLVDHLHKMIGAAKDALEGKA